MNQTAALPVAIRPLKDRELALFRAAVEKEAGIFLGPQKKALVAGRLARRLRALGLTTYESYFSHAREDRDEWVRMLDCISTNETHFFREPRHFELLENRVLPAWKERARRGERPSRVRVWSAGCSTGEEPYSLAMLLLDILDGWEVDVLATDLSTRVLDVARTGVYKVARSHEIAQKYLKRFMRKGIGSKTGLMAVGPELRKVVRFSRLNLNTEFPKEFAGFDLVFCRNVLIYFQNHTRIQVVNRLLDRLKGDGYLFLGHAESLTGVTSRVRPVIPTAYTWTERFDAKGRAS